ncbi:MAG: NADH:flavin oxidoreductase/NADH oxidase [Stagnimonas sp.]|nr:NADH:flavin oxidoreductase/NADH oxidase [Stagnimonas sp.]
MKLFAPLKLRDITLRNRIAVSPMCQYSCVDGRVDDWHLVHLGSRAVGGAGLVIAEASAVSAEGRISPADAGIYRDQHTAAWAPVTAFIRKAGAVPAIQLAHAGRKASTAAPWLGGKPIGVEAGGWSPLLGPSAIAFNELSQTPQAMSPADIQQLIGDFRAAAVRALDAGFELVELHAAHGYLLHAFLSPLSNQRSDDYGGSFDNRTRLLREVVAAVRAVWPERLPLLLRISATDWADEQGGWDIAQSVALARQLKGLGVDLIDVSSAGTLARGAIPIGPGFQVPFAAQIRREAGIATGAVGLITEPAQAQRIIESGDADLVLLARELLRDPYWPYHAAKALGAEITAPVQYQRAW